MFSLNGLLANINVEEAKNIDPAELFAQTFGAARGVLAPTEVKRSDPIEAAESVLLCDLLTRILDRVEMEEMDPS